METARPCLAPVDMTVRQKDIECPSCEGAGYEDYDDGDSRGRVDCLHCENGRVTLKGIEVVVQLMAEQTMGMPAGELAGHDTDAIAGFLEDEQYHAHACLVRLAMRQMADWEGANDGEG